jgi:chitinase
MFKLSTLLALGAGAALSLTGCQKSQDTAAEPQAISAEVTAQVKALGFDTSDLKAVSGGYLAEGDMLITPELLASTPERKFLRVGTDEQYRTTNLVTGLPRTLTVSLSTEFPASYVTARLSVATTPLTYN